MHMLRAVLLLAALATIAGAQARQLTYAPELTVDLAKQGVRGVNGLSVSTSGRMVVAVGQWVGELVAFDSLGQKLPWKTPIGRGAGAEIGWVSRTGWVGDSLWIMDNGFEQVVILDGQGRVLRSIERPAWVRPAWSDRRKYPLFSSMSMEALYPDGTMLVVPTRPRALFDTPQYDRDVVHLLRVDQDGKILRAIARAPASHGRLELRDGTTRHVIAVPIFSRTTWTVSTDGKRIALVTPPATLSDSGLLRVTMLNENGDTVFSRRYPTPSAHVTRARADTLVSRFQAFGKYSAQWIRDTVRALMPEVESRVINVMVGLDHSTWVWLRSDNAEKTALVIDARGAVAGFATFPPSGKLAVYSVDRIWTLERVGTARGIDQQFNLVRSRLQPATAARPTRSARASASPAPLRPPR